MPELVQCFYNPNANNQVMAVYTDCTTSNPEAWANQGYIECIVPKAHHVLLCLCVGIVSLLLKEMN